MLIHTQPKQKVMTKNELLTTIANLGRKPVAFEPIPAEHDEDELTRAINDPIYHDNDWDLHETVDGQALEKFWDDATKELEPEDASFTE
jgi:hypothetical protein